MNRPPTEAEWQARLEALEALVTAPFVIVLIVLITVAILYTAYYERITRR